MAHSRIAAAAIQRTAIFFTVVTQDLVSAASHDDAWTFLRILPDQLGLYDKQGIIHRLSITGKRIALGRNLKKKTVRLHLVRLFQFFHLKSAAHRCFLYQMAVITGNSQFLCQRLPQIMAAASKLSSDCNDKIFHTRFHLRIYFLLLSHMLQVLIAVPFPIVSHSCRL